MSTLATSPGDTIDNNTYWMPLYLSTIAGASTCLGAAVVFCHPKGSSGRRVVSDSTLAFSLALAGSVMVTVSVVSIGPECLLNHHQDEWISSTVVIYRVLSFGLGCLFVFGLSLLFPEPDEMLVGMMTEKQQEDDIATIVESTTSEAVSSSPNKEKASTTRSRHSNKSSTCDTSYSSTQKQSSERDSFTAYDAEAQVLTATTTLPNNNLVDWSNGTELTSPQQRRAWRASMLLFFSLLCHNFPEGLAVAASALESEQLGITVTIGIMIHNIPEGIAIAVPCLAARPNQPWLAFTMASVSGLAEPLGALVALLALHNVFHDVSTDDMFLSMENILACVAGIMISVALFQLFPEAKLYATQDRLPLLAGTFLGVIVMVVTEMTVS